MVENKAKKYYSVPEVADMLGLTRHAILKRIKKGQIKADKVGRNYVIARKDIIDDLLPGVLSDKMRDAISGAVSRVVIEYGETLKKLGKE